MVAPARAAQSRRVTVRRREEARSAGAAWVGADAAGGFSGDSGEIGSGEMV